jgi:hypothetical protein
MTDVTRPDPQIYEYYRIDSGTRVPNLGTADYSVTTQLGNGFAFLDNGNHLMAVDGTSHEIVGCELPSGTSKNKPYHPSKWILAENGDIVLQAPLGTIYLEAKNIMLSASGGDPGGNIYLKATNEVYIKSSDKITIAATDVLITASKTATLVGKNMTNIAANFTSIASTVDTFTITSVLDGRILDLIKALGIV